MVTKKQKTATDGDTCTPPASGTVFPPFDPDLPFGTTGDRKAKWIWLFALVFAALTFAALSRSNLQFTQDSRYYLLSSISQVLAALVALSVTLPLAFAGLSDYLPSFDERVVASWHFRGFVTLFTSSIALALVLLCFTCAHRLLLVVSVAAAMGCLASLAPYFIWLADRTRPKHHFDELQSQADAIVRRYETITDPAVLAEPSGEVQEYLGLLTQTASVAAQRGTSRYLGHALVDVLVFWLKYDARAIGWAAYRGGEAWGDFMVTNASNYLAVGTAAECVSKVLVRQCWQGSMRPSAGVFHSVAEALALESVPQDPGRIVAVRGLWRLGVVAQHIEPNGAGARAVAHQIAVVYADFTTVTFPQTFQMFESHVRDWFRMFADIDPTQELGGFRPLVVAEHTAFRRGLDAAGS